MNSDRIRIGGNVCLFCVVILLAACQSEERATPQRPNIVLLLADDLGWGDLRSYGGQSETPHLDQLAAEGVRFTDFYAAAPNCSPSRAGLLTGKSPAMLGMYNYRPPNHPMHLRDVETTIAEVLREAGYSTGHFGKWHLGCLPQDDSLQHPQPVDQGFQYSLGTENNARPSHLNPTNFVRNGLELPEQAGYSCQIVAGEAIKWIEKQANDKSPFFAYVAFHEPHRVVASPPELVEKYLDYPQQDAEYLANVENLDSAAGRIIDHLTERGLLDHTIVIFTSDNGSYRQASNGVLRAVKSYVYDGGIRVPGIFHWPALGEMRSEINEPAGAVDIMPTICDILDLTPPQHVDGASLLPLLDGQRFGRTKPLYWFFYRTSPEIAMRFDNYMVLGKAADTLPMTHTFSQSDMEYIKSMRLVEYELYDLSDDVSQERNIMESNPKASDYMKALSEQLAAIQQHGYNWQQLPAARGTKKLKSDWVKYSR